MAQTMKVGDNVWWLDSWQNLQNGTIYDIRDVVVAGNHVDHAMIEQGKNGGIKTGAKLADCYATKEECLDAEKRRFEAQKAEYKESIENAEDMVMFMYLHNIHDDSELDARAAVEERAAELGISLNNDFVQAAGETFTQAAEAAEEMKTNYEYTFPAGGSFDSKEEMENYAQILKNDLENGSDALSTWFIFPAGTHLENVVFNTDGSKNINSISLYSDKEIYEGMDVDLRACLEENISIINGAYYNHKSPKDRIGITGNMLNPDDDFVKAVDSMQGAGQTVMLGA